MEPGEISALGWCDIQLESIAWEREGRDLLFHLLLPHQQSATSRHRVLSFARGFNPSSTGGAARVAMAELTPAQFFVLSGWDLDWFGFECSGSMPVVSLEESRVDLLLFERSLDWTLAFTHEEYLFFARAIL